MTIRAAQRLDLAGEPASVGRARSFVREVLLDWQLDELVDTVMLLTSELSTNAVLHARTPFAVLVSHTGTEVRVEVHDGSLVAPRQRQNSRSAATGRGIALVDQLATQWGVRSERGDYAKAVWFTVPLTGVGDAMWEGDWFADL
ncbi:MAG: ATP-binding protein [Mycobacteriales bacterium]